MFEKGMICLMFNDIGDLSLDADETEVLKEGTPVRIVEVVEPACSMMDSGECQAPCKGRCCPRSIIVEDCNGKQWTVKPGIDDDFFPLIALEEGDTKMLLAKKDWKRFKLAKWTDSDILSVFKGPFYVLVGWVGISFFKVFPEPWGMVLSIVFGMFALYGVTIFVAGKKYRQNPLPYGYVLFYRNYEKNKKALEALRKEG